MFDINEMKKKRDLIVAEKNKKQNAANVVAQKVDKILEDAIHVDMALSLISEFESSLINGGSYQFYSVGAFQVHSTTSKCNFIQSLDLADEYKQLTDARVKETRHTRLLGVHSGASYTVGMFLKDEFIQSILEPAFKSLGVSLTWEYKLKDVYANSDYNYTIAID